jgi:hypothetical protein
MKVSRLNVLKNVPPFLFDMLLATKGKGEEGV